MPERPDAPAASTERLSFRRRLLLTLGSVLAVAFVALGVLAWFVAYAWLNYSARERLLLEAAEISSQIVTAEGRLAPERYAWNEPHHQFSEPRIDPYFVQVFDADKRLLLASANLQTPEAQGFPAHVLDVPLTTEPTFDALQTLRIGRQAFYVEVLPIRNAADDLLGYLQMARYDPGVAATMRRLTMLLLAILGGLLAGLLLMTWVVAGRVLAPLQAITSTTDDISPNRLSRRVPVPDDADRETAQLATTLNALLDRLEQAFEEMRRFTSNAAHELQTPLTVLRGHVDVALRRPRSEESYQQTLRVVGAEIDHLSGMVRSLLALTRLAREAHHLAYEATDLAALLREQVALFQPRARDKGVRLTMASPEHLRVVGVPALLREVISNLLDNALKYTDHGDIKTTLSDNGTVLLCVEDTGLGVAPEALPHLTDRFYRAPAVQALNVPGSGLGLALVHEILTLHDGEMTITSAVNVGTTVRVRLPAATAPTPPPRLRADNTASL